MEQDPKARHAKLLALFKKNCKNMVIEYKGEADPQDLQAWMIIPEEMR